MQERIETLPKIFPGLTPDNRRILARNILVIEVTFGDSMACRICLQRTPIGLKRVMPFEIIESIHDFIFENDDEKSEVPLNYHFAGQPSDYFDKGRDMADVVIGGLRTKRPISLFFHGIDGDDLRARRAIDRIQRLDVKDKKRIKVVISTDPFGSCNVPLDDAEEIGRQRTANALLAFQGMPNMELRVLFAEKFRSKEDELRIVEKRFKGLLPPNVYLLTLNQPTRTQLPVDRKDILDLSQGYYIIAADGTVYFSRSSGYSRGSRIGTLTNLPNTSIQEINSFVV